MNRTVSGFCLAAALGLGTTLGAQSTTTTPGQPATTTDKADREVTMTGCLSKSAAGAFMLSNARIDPTPSSTTTAPESTSTSTTAGATTTAGTTSTASTTTAGATGTTGGSANAPAMSWVLSGDNDLEKHLGHKIQVTGKTSWKGPMDQGRTSTTTASGVSTTTAASGTTTAGAASDQPRLDVKSIKMVSPSCS
jgi:hypothetical protein